MQLNLKAEHEAIRAYLKQVENSMSGVDDLIAITSEEKLEPLRQKLFSLYHALLYLEYGGQEHLQKERDLLFPQLAPDESAALEKQHEEIIRELDRSVVVIRDSLQEKPSRAQLREASVVVQKAYRGVIDMALKHMAAEDTFIDKVGDSNCDSTACAPGRA